MAVTKEDLEKYGPIEKYPECVCPLCEKREPDCWCDKEDIFKVTSITWQRDYDAAQKLSSELKAEREALREACEGIRDNCRVCMVKGIRRTLDSCSQCPTSRHSEKAVANLKRLGNIDG